MRMPSGPTLASPITDLQQLRRLHQLQVMWFKSYLSLCSSAELALTALERLAHRGGVDSDGTSGDGAGLLTAVPEKFIRARVRQAGIKLPEKFAVGMAFLPRRGASRARAAIEGATAKVGFRCLG